MTTPTPQQPPAPHTVPATGTGPGAGAGTVRRPALRIGVFLPTLGPEPGGRAREIKAAARAAEELGFESVWTGDHLIGRTQVVDGGLALATAAAVTETIRIGFGVLHLPLYPVAQAAQRIATLQHFSEGRLVLGIGSGDTGPRARWRGGVRSTVAWQAAGLDYAERDRLYDRSLDLLPRLLSGEPVRLADQPGAPELAISPRVAPPPLLLAGSSPAALRRVAHHRTGWFPGLVPPAQIAAGRRRLRELAAEHGAEGAAAEPEVSVALPFGLGPATPSRDRVTRLLTETYQVPAEHAGSVLVSGRPAEAAEQLLALADVGADRVVLSTGADDWRRQYELLAETRALL